MNKIEEKGNMIMAVMVFVFDEEKNLLLLKRADNGQWEPIKGGINIGENWMAAAVRELKEESGIVPKTKPELVTIVNDELDTSQGAKTKIKGCITYCYVSGIKPAPNIKEEENGELEHNDFKWISFENIESEKMYSPLANSLIIKIKKKLNKVYF